MWIYRDKGCDHMTRLEQYGLSRSEWNQMIEEWIIGRNAERDRAIIRRRLLDGITFERLADEFDLSTQRVQEIVYRTQETLLRHTAERQ